MEVSGNLGILNAQNRNENILYLPTQTSNATPLLIHNAIWPLHTKILYKVITMLWTFYVELSGSLLAINPDYASDNDYV